jgi:hypothetical protein
MCDGQKLSKFKDWILEPLLWFYTTFETRKPIYWEENRTNGPLLGLTEILKSWKPFQKSSLDFRSPLKA